MEASETTKRLVVWAGIVAVASGLANIRGASIEAMPALDLADGCPAAPTFIAAARSTLYWRFRRAGWP